MTLVLTVAQAAAAIQVKPRTVYSYIQSGALKAGTLPGGRGIRIRRADLDAFIEGMFAEPETELEPAVTPAPKPVNSRDFYNLGRRRH